MALCLLPAASRAQAPAGAPPFKEVQVAADAFSVGDPVPDWVEPVAIPEPGEAHPILMRLADTQYRVEQTPVVYVRRAMMINDAASLTGAGQIAIPFVPAYQKVKLHAVRVLRGGEVLDRTASSAIRFLQRETGLEQGVYIGEVTASILVEDLRVGDTLEYVYSRWGQNPVFGDKFVDMAFWDQGPPTLLRRLVLSYPAARQIRWRVAGGRRAKPVVPKGSVQDGMRKLVFEERFLPKLSFEALTPPDYPVYRLLQFSEFSGWDDVAAWADDLFRSQGVHSKALRDVVETLRGKATDEERVVGALEFVQSQIRYFSVALGESSHRPNQPDVVLERRYGDCKDKSLLLIALLDALGIRSRPVLLFLGRLKMLDGALPSPQHFNHVIVEVALGGNVFYLDPTRFGQHGLLESMGQVHEGAEVLVVSLRTGGLTTIRDKHAADLVHNEITEAVVLAKFDADAELEVRHVWRGAVAESARVVRERLSPEEVAKAWAAAMEQRYAGARLVGEPDIRDDRVNNVTTTTVRFTVPKFATERDGVWFVRYSPTNMKGVLAPPPLSTRTVPLLLSAFPYHAKYSFQIQFPEDVSVISDPSKEAVRGKYFSYTVAGFFRGNLAKVTVALRFLNDRVEVSDLRKYDENVRSLGKIPVGVIAIPKAAHRRVARAAEPGLGETLRRRHRETIERSTLAIKSGKLGETDLSASYCLRASANGELGNVRKGLSDANEAVRLTPNSADAFLCRAYAHMMAGQFEASIADYSKAIILGATNPHTLQQRGVAKFYAKKLAEAAEDFARTNEIGEATFYSDLWLTWTYRRLGKELPARVLERAKAEPRGDWPRPALAVLTGNLAPEEMMALLARKKGDDRRMALAEGYFYLGQYYLLQGDKAKAREAFEKVRRQDIIVYTEHMAAKFELEALGGAVSADAPRQPPSAAAPPPGTPAKKATRRPRREVTRDWKADLWK